MVSNHIINNTSYLLKRGKDIKVIKIRKNKDFKYSKDYIGQITIKQNEEYIWNYNNYFRKNKFIKPYDSLDWIVIGPTNFSTSYNTSNTKYGNAYKLSEGDMIKLGKITFLIRKIKVDSKENIKETKRNESNSSMSLDNCNSNMNLNINNSINEDLAIYDRYNDNLNININNISKNPIKSSIFMKNNKNDLAYTINNKLKFLYMKLKNVNEKQKLKTYRCRLCFCEGSFEGKNPLISPCKCMGSVTYIHLNCLRKWLTSKVTTKNSSTNNIYCYTFKSLECEICKTIIPEIVEYRGKFISLLEFRDIEPPYLILQTMYQYNSQNRNISEFNVIFVMSFKTKDYLTIGRNNNSDIRLGDVSVSRYHSKISYFEGNFYIEDYGSKFGTLLLIQNNILFLPYKKISIQTGKCHLIFKLTRTCLGLFKCYKNALYEKMAYDSDFKSNDKKVYSQILENYNNNIVDPIEKFSSISGSCSASENNNTININDDDKKSEENNKIEDEENEDEKTEKLSDNNININEDINLRYMFENSINANQVENDDKFNNVNIKNNENNENNEYNNNNISLGNRKTINYNQNNEKKETETKLKSTMNFFVKKLSDPFNREQNKNNNSMALKQNESYDILFQNNYNNNKNLYNNKTNFSVSNIINLLKRNNINKKQASVININCKDKLNMSPLNKEDIEGFAQANTQRVNLNTNKNISQINNIFE